MKISYEGIGAVCATFKTNTAISGHVVKLTTGGTVEECASGENFIGVAGVPHNGVCAVQLEGLVELPYSEAAPALGYTSVAGDGKGGVLASGGRRLLVIDVDETRKTCVIML